jgi:hypothetical protein
MVYRSVEGFDGGVNGRLNTDKNAYSQGDSYDGKKSSPFVIAKMTERDAFEEMKEDHGQYPNVKIQISNEFEKNL